jgi:putative hydrolase of the HAD superfamily
LVPFVQQQVSNISRETINCIYLSASLGNLTSQEFWTEVGLADRYPEIETEYLNSQLTIDPHFGCVVKELAKQYRLGIISNDLSAWSMYLRAKFARGIFEVAIISGDVGIRKPNPQKYERFLSEANVVPEHCLFVDDRAKNLKPANDLGMKTARFARNPDANLFKPDREISDFRELSVVVEDIF